MYLPFKPPGSSSLLARMITASHPLSKSIRKRSKDSSGFDNMQHLHKAGERPRADEEWEGCVERREENCAGRGAVTISTVQKASEMPNDRQEGSAHCKHVFRKPGCRPYAKERHGTIKPILCVRVGGRGEVVRNEIGGC